MHVIATAGHVDHGKSALVRALTGMEPDRWSEERRRGMTIDLGYAWTSLPSGEQVAFVDVPGHERFASNMLAGVGPVPAVLLVVAADSGWAAQTEEHTAAVAALGVRHGLLVATRADLADPAPALAAARERMSRLGLAPAEGVATSAVTGEGLAELRAALDRLLAALPAPDRSPTARVRLWIDRAFTIRGAGTVVTGTLGAGRLLTGQTLQLSPPGARPVTVRGLESLGQPVAEALAVSRVAVNLRGLSRQEVRRGQALLTPDSWLLATEVDARMVPAGPQTPAATDLATQLVLHIGSAGVPVSVRPLAADLVRLRLATPLPLQVGDRALLRDPGRRRVVAGALVLDPDPPSLGRRGAATARARELASDTGRPEVAREVARRGAVRAGRLLALGCDPGALAGEAPGGAAGGSAGQVRRVGDWLVDERVWRSWQEQLRAAVRRTGDRELFARGLSRAEAVAAAGLADPALLDPLLAGLDDVASVDGRVRVQLAPRLPAHLAEAIAAVRAGLAAHPFAAPEAAELARLGLGHRELAAARDAGEILLLPGDVVLAPDAATRAAGLLAGLPAPFTLSQARQALGTTRRVAVPLLEHLDQTGVTLRVDATGRRLR